MFATIKLSPGTQVTGHPTNQGLARLLATSRDFPSGPGVWSEPKNNAGVSA
jgi:hypothetical protein